MITPYISQQPVTDFSLRFSNLIYATTLAASTAQTFTVPGNAPRYKAVFHFSPNESVWVADNATAALPGSSFASSTCELNPTCREVKAGDVLSFISNTASTYVSVSLYAMFQPN